MAPDELVSVIVPTYFRNEHVQDAIESAIGQSYDPVEIIVVDDSGERHAEAVVTDYDVSYIPHDTNEGVEEARNTGVDAASGEYIQFLDDDDVLFEDKLERQVNLLESNPDVRVAYGGIENRRGKILPDPEPGIPALHRALGLSWPTTITSSLLISRDVLEDVLPLEAGTGDDIGLKIELAKRTNFDYVDDVLVKLGDSPDGRGASMDFAREMNILIEKYDHLYRQLPEEVHRSALSKAYECYGYALLSERTWSLEAIISLAKAQYYSSNTDPKRIGGLVASIFGQPGREVAAKWYNAYRRSKGTTYERPQSK